MRSIAAPHLLLAADDGYFVRPNRGSGGMVNGPGLAMAQATGRQLNAPLRLPRAVSYEVVLSARCRSIYSNAHAYHINSIAINSDQETFISADDLRINLWNLEVTDQSFNIVDIKPANMEDLTEVRPPPGLCQWRMHAVPRYCFRFV